jgi:hypothetical protein
LVGCSSIFYNTISIDRPRRIIVELGSIEIIPRPIIFNHVILEQVTCPIGIVDVIQVIGIRITRSGFSKLAILHRIERDVVIRSIIHIKWITAVSRRITTQIIDGIAF